MSETTLPFHRLSFVDEGDEVVVGRADTGSYAVLPADGAALLRHMVDGEAPQRAAQWYESTFGEPIDIDDFVATLHDLGFVRVSDGAATAADSKVEVSRQVRWRRLGAALFSPAAWLVYAGITSVWVWLGLTHDDLMPDPGQLFFTSSILVVQAVVVFGQLPLIFLHEGFHTMAGRRLGLPSRLGMSNRFMYVVFETQMNGLYSVSRGKRYLPFLSGLLCDVVVLAGFGLFAQLTREPLGSLSLAGRVAMALAFTVLMRICWQFQFFLRTDVYYVFATALRCHDLHAASVQLMRNRIWRALKCPHRVVDESQWTRQDRRAGAWYGPLVVLGIAVMLLLAVFGTAPVIVQYFAIVGRNLSGGRFDALFWDALVSVVINIGQLVLVAYLARRKRRAAVPWPAAPGRPAERGPGPIPQLVPDQGTI
jgi:hypothetical protein